MNFELQFSSANKEFTLNVDQVATLDKTRIPTVYLVHKEDTITTTDQAAIRAITTSLLHSPITPARETRHGLLVQANGSRWLLYGTLHDDVARADGRAVMKIRARMIGGHALQGLQRPTLGPGKSVALTKKVRHALDDHQVPNKKRRRITEPERVFPVVAPPLGSAAAPTAVPQVTQITKDEDAKVESAEQPSAVLDRRQRERLKKMIVTLLSLRAINKSAPQFRDLYQHTLQASSFALACRRRRRQAHADETRVKKEEGEAAGEESWEESAMRISQSVISVFLD